MEKPTASQSQWEGSAVRAHSIRGAATATRGSDPSSLRCGAVGQGIITQEGLIAINIKNQINMSRCVFHFLHVCGV